jgi:hypothetical protein
MRVVRSSKTRKIKQTGPVILKEASPEGIKSAIGRHLPARERKMLLAIAQVLAGKLR